MTDPEELLSQTLHRRAKDAAYAPTPMRDVLAAARGIRRHRRRRALLAVAAAIAVAAVPTAVVLGTDDPSSPDRPTGPPPWVSQAPPSAADVRLPDLERGPDPRVAYAEGHDFVSTDGSRHPVAVGAGITAITPYHGGFLVADDTILEGTVGLHLLDDEGRETDRWCTAGSPVVSGDELLTAYATSPCPEMVERQPPHRIHRGIASGMGEGEAVQDIGEPVSLVGFLGERVVFTGRSGGRVWVTDLAGPPVRLALASGGGVSPDGLVSGQAADDPASGVVMDPDTGDVRWRVQGTMLGDFSPDGDHVLGLVDTGEGPCCPEVFLVATGELVPAVGDALAELGVPDLPLVWEDDAHLLGVLTRGEQRAIVRIGLDGEVTRASDVLPADRRHDIVWAARP